MNNNYDAFRTFIEGRFGFGGGGGRGRKREEQRALPLATLKEGGSEEDLKPPLKEDRASR